MDLTVFEEDNLASPILDGEIPEKAKKEPCWLGIDEAGRGPVLGPMVYGTCFSPISLKKEMEEMGFADSKTLTEAQRDSIFEKIDGASHIIGWIVHVLSPTYISNSMLKRSKYNLNTMSHDTAIGLIQRALDKGVNVREVYVDTVGPPEKYQAKLKGIFPQLDITVAKKADATYQIVGAASICAKVARDKAVKCWKFTEGIECEEGFGSGYPADPLTKKFMSQNLDPVFGFPQLVRFSWSTASTIVEKNGVPVHWEDEDEDEENSKPEGTESVSKYFKVKTDKSLLGKRKHAFFNDRCLKQVSSF